MEFWKTHPLEEVGERRERGNSYGKGENQPERGKVKEGPQFSCAKKRA